MTLTQISVVIPAYNEEKRIEKTLRKVIEYCKKKFARYEIIVVDDCSDDNTRKIALKYKKENVRILKNNINKGKGYSVKRGILEARYDLVLFSDADLATPIEELSKFLEYTGKGHDIVIASRNLKESKIKIEQPFYRQLMGRTFPLLVELLVLRGFKDTQCGFKLFKTAIAKKIVSRQTINGFSFDVELLFIAKKLKLKIKELPVVWIDQKGSKVSPFKDSFRMLADIMRIRVNGLRDVYK